MVIWGSAASANRASTLVVLSSRSALALVAHRTLSLTADTRLGRSAKQRHGARWEPREQAFERVVHALVHVPLEPLGPEHLIA